MSKRLAQSLGGVALVAILSLLVWIFRAGAGKTDGDDEKDKEAPIRTASRVSRTAEGDSLIRLDRDAQARIRLQTSRLSAASFSPQLIAYGRLQEDPSRSFELRAPAAGILRAAPQKAWPVIGAVLQRSTFIGIIEPRLTSVDRLNLMDRLNTARADADAAGASLEASRAALERARALNADNQNVSDRALQEAEARLQSDEAKRRAALEAIRLMESGLRTPPSSADGSAPLAIDKDGEVTEVLAQPGESVESGQVLLRVKKFDMLIARIQVPGGQGIPSSVSSARLVALDYESTWLRGERIAAGTTIDPETHGQFVLFRVAAPRNDLRPGLAVTAYLTLPGELLRGVVIPESAVVRAAGKLWVYVKSGEDQFVRKEVPADNPTGDGWFAARGFSDGDEVVTVGAQTLLSEELKSQIQVGEENPA